MSIKASSQLRHFFIAGITTINLVLAVPNSAFSNEETRYIFQGNGQVKEGQNSFSCQHLIVHSRGNFKLTCNNYQLSLGRPKKSSSGKLFYRTASVKKGNLVSVYTGDIGCSIRVKSILEQDILEKFRCAGIYGSFSFEADFNSNESIRY